MAVYVDDMHLTEMGRFGRMKMCHMVADSTDELLAMADRIGVQRKWIQYPGTHREHFDIAISKRVLAVQYGAIEVTMRDTSAMARAKREAALATVSTKPTAMTRATDAAALGDPSNGLSNGAEAASS